MCVQKHIQSLKTCSSDIPQHHNIFTCQLGLAPKLSGMQPQGLNLALSPEEFCHECHMSQAVCDTPALQLIAVAGQLERVIAPALRVGSHNILSRT